jgi:hypothetical protein
MWPRLVNRLNNWWISLTTYADLRPDLSWRRRINNKLRNRPAHDLQDWYKRFWEPIGITREVAAFVYHQVAQYSGLCFAQVLPTDRLQEDLKLPLVCWFDWELSLSEDFSNQLGVDLDEHLDLANFSTVSDLVIWLNQTLEKLKP